MAGIQALLDLEIKHGFLPERRTFPHHQAMLDRTPLTNEQRAERIRLAIEASQYSKTQIASMMGFSDQALTGWEKTGRIGRTTSDRLAALLGKHPDHFRYVDELKEDFSEIKAIAQSVGLGNGREAAEYAESHKLKFRTSSLRRKGLNPDSLCVVYGEGDSMLPRIHHGDAILYDTADTKPRHKAIFVIERGGEYSAKMCRILDDRVYFEALNPDGDHGWREPQWKDAKRKQIEIVGRVRWIGSWED